jgi:predicted MFS family arabinose efflux permease
VTLLVIRALHGVGFGFASTLVISVAQRSIPPSRRGEGTAFLTVGTSLATAVGPLVALVMVSASGYRPLFVLCTAVGVAGVALGVTVREPAERASRSDRRARSAAALSKSALPASMVIGILGFCYSGVLAFIAEYEQVREVPSMASSFFLAYAIAVGLARLGAGYLQDRFGDVLVITPAIASFAVGLVALADVQTILGTAVAGILCGAGFGSAVSSLLAVAVASTDAEHATAAVATYYLFMDVGSAIGPVVLGWVREHQGYAAMFNGSGAVVALCGGAYVAFSVLERRFRAVGGGRA